MRGFFMENIFMKLKFTRAQILITLSLFLGINFTANAEYFKTLSQIKKIPADSKPVLACNDTTEIKHFLTLLKKSSTQKESDYLLDNFAIQSLTLDKDNATIEDGTRYYVIYKGDFSNEGVTEYALVSTNSVGEHNNMVNIYKLIDNHLVDTGLGDIISRDLLNGRDLGPDFYNWVADPFAIKKDGKTYLRFMNYPSTPADRSDGYNTDELRLCTYILQGEKITLSGPNLKYSKKQNKLVEATDCTGGPRAPAQ